jgi:BirA family biotin operon repressor/biotin-[acetyl-CoA-carboxylase] ligase
MNEEHEMQKLDTDQIRDQIVEAFIQANGQFVSGNDLSQQLGVTRTAIWKHIRQLEGYGFVFESAPRAGYCLRQVPNLVLEPLLKRHMRADADLGRKVLWYPRVDSTNIVAAQMAAKTVPDGTIVVAMEQTGGRGRRGRQWASPRGGLWFTIILKRAFPLRSAAELTLLTSVAVRRAILKETGLVVSIKWPNDLLYQGKKLCGILAEIRADGENVQHAILGIGINVNIKAADFPESVRPIATSLSQATSTDINLTHLTAAILTELEPWLNDLKQEGSVFYRVADEWRAASATLGQKVRVQTHAGILEGYADRVDEKGVLYLTDANGQEIPIYSGDVLF